MTLRKLDFVIGGAQKSATTTLDAIFRNHPQIQMAKVKETHFFDDETRDWTAPDYDKLHAHFPADNGRVRGEATPITLYWRPAIRRLRAYSSDIKFVFLLRNPVTRAFANWQYECAAGRETLTFTEAIREGRERVRAFAEAEDLHRSFSYVERGFYGRQLSYVLDYFPRDRIHCEITEEFAEDQAAALQRMSRFLGIDKFAGDTRHVRRHAARVTPSSPALAAADAAYLSDLFDDDIALLESILGRPIAKWRQSEP